MQDIIDNQFLLLEFSYLDDEDDGDTKFTTVSHSTSRDSFLTSMEVILLQVHQAKTIWATNSTLPTISIARARN